MSLIAGKINRIHILLVPRHNDTNTATSDIAEANVETSELVSNHEEHAIRLPGVFDLWKEVGSEAERECDFRWLIKVGLENVLVEDEEALQDLEFMLVGH